MEGPGWGLGGGRRACALTRVQTCTRACVDPEAKLGGRKRSRPSTVLHPTTSLCPTQCLGAPSLLLDAPLPAGPPSIQGRGSNPLSLPTVRRSTLILQGRLHQGQVEPEASRSLRPPVPAGPDAALLAFQLPPRPHTLPGRPASERTPNPACHADSSHLVVAATAAAAATVTPNRARPVASPRPPSPQPRDPRLRRCRRGSERSGPPPGGNGRVHSGRASDLGPRRGQRTPECFRKEPNVLPRDWRVTRSKRAPRQPIISGNSRTQSGQMSHSEAGLG